MDTCNNRVDQLLALAKSLFIEERRGTAGVKERRPSAVGQIAAGATLIRSKPGPLVAAGELVQIPNQVVSLANTAGTFKPFDLNNVIGDTTPTQPAPRGRSSQVGWSPFVATFMNLVHIGTARYVA